jgi:tetratricopeptide (TPR) repeat protein
MGVDAATRWLVSEIASGNCILFVGAGLAATCRDESGRTGPSGTQLAREMAEHFLGNYQDWPLALTAAYAEALASRPEVEQFVRDRLKGLMPSEALLKLSEIPWKAIYTTNYDLLIEDAYAANGARVRQVHPIYADRDRLRDLTRNEIPLYKVHGCISRIGTDSGRLVLTGEDNALAREMRRRLFVRLGEDMSEYTVLYIGYGRQDPQFEQLLGEVFSALGGTNNVPRSFALEPEFQDFERMLWESKNIALIDAKAEEYIPWLQRETSALSTERERRVLSLPGILPDGASPSEETVELVRKNFELVREELGKGASEFESFFKGNRPTWGQIGAGCDSKREIADEITLELIRQREMTGPQLVLINAEAGAGKTTLLRRVAADLTVVWDLPVLNLRELGSLEFEVIDSLARLMDQRLYVCVDEAHDRVREMSGIVTRARRGAISVTFICSARANEWAERANQFPLPPVTTFDLEYLTEAEIDDLLLKLDEFDALGVLAALSPPQRRAELRGPAERQLLVALREATEGTSFDRIIQNEFDSIPSREAQDAYLFICAVYQARVPLRAGVLRRLTDIPFEEFDDRLLAPTQRIIVEESENGSTSYRARHRVIAQIVVDYKLPAAADRLAVLKRILSLLDIGYEEDLQAYRRISHNRELVEYLGTYDLKIQFYQACREVDPRDAIVAQHWAILAMDNGRFGLAESLLTEAQRLAPRDPSIQHSQGMLAFNQYRAQRSQAWDQLNFDKAQETFRRLITRYPTQAAAYDSLARLYALGGDREDSPAARVDWYSKADDVLRQGSRETSDKSALLATAGGLYDAMGEFQDADTAFVAALRANPGNASARNLYARFLVSRGNAARAIEILEAGVQFDTDDRRLRHQLANALALEGRPADEVIAQFRLSVQSLTHHWLNAFDLAVYLYLMGREDEARSVFEDLRALDLDVREKRRMRANPLFADRFDLQREGTLVNLRDTYGFIRLRGSSLDVYLDRYHVGPDVDSRLEQGITVGFRLRFSLHGPLATSVIIR